MAFRTRVSFNLDAYADSNPTRLLTLLQESEWYNIEKEEARDDALESGQRDDRPLYKVFRNDGEEVVQGIFLPERGSFSLTLYNPEVESEEVERLKETLGDNFTETVQISRRYERLLSGVDEGNISEFVEELVEEIEGLGYDVTTERSAGTWLSSGGNGSETVKEYKWWFYIREGENGDEMAPHGLDLYFTEDGIHMVGNVTVGADNQAAFEQLLTEFEH